MSEESKLFGPYDTGSDYWQFKYKVICSHKDKETYTFTFDYYLYRPGNSSYYDKPVWTFYAWANGQYNQYDYKPQ